MSEEKCQKCWNGEYPLFIEWDESMQMEFVDDEEELVEFCTSHQLNPRELQYYDAVPPVCVGGQLSLQRGNSIMGMARHPVILGCG